MRFFTKHKLYYPLAAFIFFLLAYNEDLLFPEQRDLNSGKAKIEKELMKVDEIIRKEITIPVTEGKLFTSSLSEKENRRLTSLPFSVLAFKSDSLVYWNNNSVIQQQIDFFPSGYSFFKFRNGSYVVWKKDFARAAPAHPDHLLILIPLKYEYTTENDYLQPTFADAFDLPDYLTVTAGPFPDSREIKSPTGSTVFFLSIDPFKKNVEVNHWSVAFFFAGFILLILFLNYLLRLIPSRKYSWLKLSLPVLLLAGLYYLLSDKHILPLSVRNWDVFDADIFASPDVAYSLGNMLLQGILLLWISIRMSRDILLRPIRTESSALKFLIHFLAFSVILFIGIYFVYATKGLVRDSKISFRFYNPFDPDNISLIAIFCITILLFSFFIITFKLLKEASWFSLRSVYWWAALLCAGIICLLYFPLFNMGGNRFIVTGSLCLLILVIQLFRIRSLSEIGFVRLFILLVLFSFGAAWMIQYYGNEKEINNRISFAKKLFNERDNVTEYLLNQSRYDIRCDYFVQNYFVNPHLSTKEFSDRLKQLYFSSGFNRYEIEFIAYNTMGNPLKMDYQAEYGYFGNNLLRNAEQISQGELYFSSSPSGTASYISVYPILYNDQFAGRLFIVLTSKVYKEINVYPELLLEEKNKIPQATEDYSFAIYDKGKLIDQGGDYSYSFVSTFPADKLVLNEPSFMDESSFSHLLLLQKDDKLIVVSRKQSVYTSFLSYFSYLFIILFLLIVTILGTGFIRDQASQRWNNSLLQRTSFRNIIQVSFVIIIFFSVIVIGVITGRFFISQFNKYTNTNLTQKLKMVDESVSYLVQHTSTGDSICGFEPKNIRDILNSNISDMADIHDMDINFYDSTGNLITTSQPGIFEKGMISKKMNANAFYNLTKKDKTLIVQREHIGKLVYLSGYHPVRNTRGELLAFLNIPYFNTTKNLNEQIGFFFSSLVNILVFALIIAGFLAPFISNQITGKLAFIAEKFKLINLSHRNELIEWSSKDELGQLVTEFNKMVVKLDESAQLLSKSERESAWREMAKQVAHEIKNPLTPMKLSIQHLQRAYAQNDPRAKEMAEKMSKTMIEQIDNLSKIATEFSSFAKMPRPENELLNLHTILQSVVDLFRQEHQVKIEFILSAQNDVLLADRNQLIRVFNNLILNAVQAIPENKIGLIEIKTWLEDHFIVISFKDNGMGIDEEASQKVFTPSFTTKSSGTGLGLAICKSIIEQSGGKISFTSRIGEGTVFYIRLPLVAG